VNCVLIGYRGTGKSTIGRLVAPELGFEYVCLDEEIVGRAGLPIPGIVERHGWERFRDLESEVVEEFSARGGQVIDAGGGAIVRPRNAERLRAGGVVFLLEAEIADIVARIGSDDQRPSLTGTKSFTDEVAEVLEARRSLYREAAHHTIDTSALSAEDAAALIVRTFRAHLGRCGP
jgi:shikimate kinase